MNKKVVISIVIGVTLLSGIQWIRSKGSIINALNIPPTFTVRKASTEFVLSQTASDSWGDYLLVKSPFVTRVKPAINALNSFMTPGDAFTITATDSNGLTWNLRWDIRRPDNSPENGTPEQDDVICIWRPDSCPPDVKWYDVTLKSKWGGSAIWRATNLQVARHFGQDAPTKPAMTFNGMTVSCMADRFVAVNGSPKSLTLRSFFIAKGKPSDGKDWRVRIESSVREWDNPARVSKYDLKWSKSKPTSFGNPMDPCQYWMEHYPQRNHYIYATGSFALFEKEQIQRTIPFALKIPIIFKRYTRPVAKGH